MRVRKRPPSPRQLVSQPFLGYNIVISKLTQTSAQQPCWEIQKQELPFPMAATYHERCARHHLLSGHYAASVALVDWVSIQCTAMRDAQLTATRRLYKAPAAVCSGASWRPLSHWNYYAPASRRKTRGLFSRGEREKPGDASVQLCDV